MAFLHTTQGGTVKTISFFFTLASLFMMNFSFSVQAETKAQFHYPDGFKDYATIANKTVEEVPTELELLPEPGDKNLGEAIMMIDKLVALGKKVWPIIEAGKPVVNAHGTGVLEVLPHSSDMDLTSMDLDFWSLPKGKSYRVAYKNLLGMEVVSFQYTVVYQHGGSFMGKGKYLSGIRVYPSKVAVSWGFTFDASAELANISNLGSQEETIAGATIKVNYSIKTPLQTIDSEESVFVSGNGDLSHF